MMRRQHDQVGSSGCVVFGATGVIGSALVNRLRDEGQPFVAPMRRSGNAGGVHFDLSLTSETWPQFPPSRCAFLLAGVTNLAACEADPVGTDLINVTRTLQLARRLSDAGTHVVCVSTNLVLSDSGANAAVTAPYNPQCVYGDQKMRVETALLECAHPGGVLRITKIAESLLPLFRGWASKLRKGEAIEAFADLVAAPTPVSSVVDALLRIGFDRESGVFHIGGDRDFSYAEMAGRLAERMAVDPRLVRPTTSTAAGVTLVSRPRHTTLDTSASRHQLGLAAVSTERVLDDLFERAIKEAATPTRVQEN